MELDISYMKIYLTKKITKFSVINKCLFKMTKILYIQKKRLKMLVIDFKLEFQSNKKNI